MTFPDAIRTCLRKYATFSGRAPRSEYWWFVLFLILGQVLLTFVDSALFGTTAVETGEGSVSVRSNGPLVAIFGLAMLLPALAAGWRRMHDTGRSGLYLLYPLIVMVGILTFAGLLGGLAPLMSGDLGAIVAGGGIILIVATFVFIVSPLIVLWWLTRPSEPRPNAWGPVPEGRP